MCVAVGARFRFQVKKTKQIWSDNLGQWMIWFMLLCFYVCVVMMLSQNLGSTDVANSATFICVSGRTWNIRYSTTFDQVQLFNYTALSVKVPSSPFTSFHTVLRVCHVCMFVSLFDFDLSWFVLFVCLFNVYFFLVLCVFVWFVDLWFIGWLFVWFVDWLIFSLIDQLLVCNFGRLVFVVLLVTNHVAVCPLACLTPSDP